MSAVSELAALLGPGEAGLGTNVYERKWRLGIFGIRVITWPRELNRVGSNVFEGKNPYLWVSANVIVEPDFPFIEPIDNDQIRNRPLLAPGMGFRIRCQSKVYARRNRTPGSDLVGLSERDFVIQSAACTVSIPLGEVDAVKHGRVTPGRYSGSSEISIEAKFLRRHA